MHLVSPCPWPSSKPPRSNQTSTGTQSPQPSGLSQNSSAARRYAGPQTARVQYPEGGREGRRKRGRERELDTRERRRGQTKKLAHARTPTDESREELLNIKHALGPPAKAPRPRPAFPPRCAVKKPTTCVQGARSVSTQSVTAFLYKQPGMPRRVITNSGF